MDAALGPAQGNTDDRRAYRDRLRLTARRSALVGGLVLLVAFPLWSLFDWLVLPSRAGEFAVVRGVFEVPIGLTVLALWDRRIGGRWPEQTAFVLLALPQLAIAWMIPRSQPQLTAYLLGFSLTIFGSAVVMVWRWQLTVCLTALTFGATAAASAMYPSALSGSSVATIAFYLGTAGVVALVGQVHRYRSGWDQFRTEAALEREQLRNEELVKELRRLSTEDPLTGVANRRAWESWLRQEWRRAQRGRSRFSVVICDFDRFKEVNDSRGHAFGDEVLRVGAAALRQAVRSTDFLARLGGDEFIVGCPDTELVPALALAHRMADTVRSLRWPDEMPMTLSFGVAELCMGDDDVVSLVSRADRALYKAKISRDAVVSALT